MTTWVQIRASLANQPVRLSIIQWLVNIDETWMCLGYNNNLHPIIWRLQVTATPTNKPHSDNPGPALTESLSLDAWYIWTLVIICKKTQKKKRNWCIYFLFFFVFLSKTFAPCQCTILTFCLLRHRKSI